MNSTNNWRTIEEKCSSQAVGSSAAIITIIIITVHVDIVVVVIYVFIARPVSESALQ